tara:strand:+ start:380 stop:1081 length:702 start_codon:yes stop_codon:yes gene_type:complete
MAKNAKKKIVEALLKAKQNREEKSRLKKLAKINEGIEEGENMTEEEINNNPTIKTLDMFLAGQLNEEVTSVKVCARDVAPGEEGGRGSAKLCILKTCNGGCGKCGCYEIGKTTGPGGGTTFGMVPMDKDMMGESHDVIQMMKDEHNSGGDLNKVLSGCSKSDVFNTMMENVTGGGFCGGNMERKGIKLEFDNCGDCPCPEGCACVRKVDKVRSDNPGGGRTPISGEEDDMMRR